MWPGEKTRQPAIKYSSSRGHFNPKRLAAVCGAVKVRRGDIYMSCCFVVIVPQDANPFTVERQQMVRLSQDAISGSKIVAEVDGPAEVVAENSL